VAAGGIVGGYTLYIKNGIPNYEYNWFTQDRYRVAGKDKLPPGPAAIRIEFKYDGGGYGKGGMVRLFVNDKLAGEGRIEKTEAARFSADETFDIGRDTGSPVSDRYQSPFPFNGILKKVEIKLAEGKLEAKDRGALRRMESRAARARD